MRVNIWIVLALLFAVTLAFDMPSIKKGRTSALMVRPCAKVSDDFSARLPLPAIMYHTRALPQHDPWGSRIVAGVGCQERHMDLDREHDHLAQAEQHIAEVKKHIRPTARDLENAIKRGHRSI
jgi:hypothetical protein